MLTAFANGTILGTRIGSAAPTVLALHGWAGTGAQLFPALHGSNAVALDLPGFGASPAPEEVWGAAEYAHSIASVLDEFSGPAVILGYSFGGRIAVEIAARYPNRVSGLVLTGVPLLRRVSPKAPPFMFRAAKWAHRRNLVSDDYMEAQRQKRGSLDYRRASGIMRDILVRAVNETYEEALGLIEAPTHMVWGALDTAAPLWIVDEARGLMPKTTEVKRTIVANGDHSLPLHNPEPLRQALQGSAS